MHCGAVHIGVRGEPENFSIITVLNNSQLMTTICQNLSKITGLYDVSIKGMRVSAYVDDVVKMRRVAQQVEHWKDRHNMNLRCAVRKTTPTKLSFAEHLDRIKEEYNMMDCQLTTQRHELEKLNEKREQLQQRYFTYSEITYGLNMEIAKQAEIAKRYNGILAQLKFYLPPEQQQSAAAAMQRSKQLEADDGDGELEIDVAGDDAAASSTSNGGGASASGKKDGRQSAHSMASCDTSTPGMMKPTGNSLADMQLGSFLGNPQLAALARTMSGIQGMFTADQQAQLLARMSGSAAADEWLGGGKDEEEDEESKEKQNLTEYNTALNRRIPQLPISAEEARRKKRPRGNVAFIDEEDVINPEDVDPSVGRFRNLVTTAIISNTASPAQKRPASGPDGGHARKIVRLGRDHARYVTPMASSLQDMVVDSAPDLASIDPAPSGSAPLYPVEDETEECPKKKKYVKESWPGRKPGIL